MNQVVHQNSLPLGYPYAVKNGNYLTCNGTITEIINGSEVVRKCGTNLTCYGDKRDSDKVEGRNLCYKCYRHYYRNKSKETREIARRIKTPIQNSGFNGQNSFIGLMPPEYQQQKYSHNSAIPQNHEIPSLYSKYVETNDDYGVNIDNTSDEEKSKLKQDFEKLSLKYESQKDELESCKEKIKIMELEQVKLQSSFEALLITSQSTKQKLEDMIKTSESEHSRIEREITDKVLRIISEETERRFKTCGDNLASILTKAGIKMN